MEVSGTVDAGDGLVVATSVSMVVMVRDTSDGVKGLMDVTSVMDE